MLEFGSRFVTTVVTYFNGWWAHGYASRLACGYTLGNKRGIPKDTDQGGQASGEDWELTTGGQASGVAGWEALGGNQATRERRRPGGLRTQPWWGCRPFVPVVVVYEWAGWCGACV